MLLTQLAGHLKAERIDEDVGDPLITNTLRLNDVPVDVGLLQNVGQMKGSLLVRIDERLGQAVDSLGIGLPRPGDQLDQAVMLLGIELKGMVIALQPALNAVHKAPGIVLFPIGIAGHQRLGKPVPTLERRLDAPSPQQNLSGVDDHIPTHLNQRINLGPEGRLARLHPVEQRLGGTFG